MTPTAPPRPRLEPLAGPAAAVILAHLLLGILAWIFIPLLSGRAAHTADSALVWLAPADFLARVDPPKAPPAPTPASPSASPPPPAPAPASPPKPAPLRATAKYITLSPRLPELEGPPAPPKPFKPVPSLLEIAQTSAALKKLQSADMRAVDDAVQQTCLKEWRAPSTHLAPPGQRTAVVNLSIEKDGSVSEVTLVKTGAPALNVSIVELFQRVNKIPVTLPSSFQKPRYDLQVNFQIE